MFMTPRLPSHYFARRDLLRTTAAGFLAPSYAPLMARNDGSQNDQSFDILSRDLLRDWCGGMLVLQINDPSDPAKHGALADTLHHHGDLLDAERRQRWLDRLGRAGGLHL
jgi:hypothetical protein